jgi:hypothetical protein
MEKMTFQYNIINIESTPEKQLRKLTPKEVPIILCEMESNGF